MTVCLSSGRCRCKRLGAGAQRRAERSLASARDLPRWHRCSGEQWLLFPALASVLPDRRGRSAV